MNKIVLLEAISLIRDMASFDSDMNETATTIKLVYPFLQASGFGPVDIHFEYGAPFVLGDGKKTRDKIDIALDTNDKPLSIGIEVKKLGSDISKVGNQLIRYMAQMPNMGVGLVTDGIYYDIYTKTDDNSSIDKIGSFNLLDPDCISFLSFIGFGKNFSWVTIRNSIVREAEKDQAVRRVVEFFSGGWKTSRTFVKMLEGDNRFVAINGKSDMHEIVSLAFEKFYLQFWENE